MKLILFLKNLGTFKKKIIISILDTSLFNLSFWISYNLRDIIFIIPNYNQLIHLIIGNCIFFFFYFYFKIYNTFLRFFDIGNIKIFVKFFTLLSFVYLLISYALNLATIQKFSPLVIGLICYSLVIVSRYIIYILINYNNSKKKNISIIGSDESVINFLNSPKITSTFDVKFFFTNSKHLINRNISSTTIKDIKEIFETVKKENINNIVIISNSIQIDKIRKIIIELKKLNVSISYYNNELLIPNISQNKSLPDFSVREINFFFKKNLKIFKNKVIFISGAGGSIGSELSKQLLLFRPKKIILYDFSEYNLFTVTQNIQTLKNKTQVVSVLGDICNYNLLKNVFKKYKPNIVFHAAAIKHVNIAEKNIFSCLQTNILGTKNLLEVFRLYKETKKFVLISTDKAVKPINIMGLSKRFAELLTKSEQANSNGKSYITVRFGNVANSSGSVFTIWKKQLMNSEKLTITDPNATRYLMSISEAVNLVLDASILGKGGEVFVLDMGRPYKIIELLKFFLDNYNLKFKDPHNPQGISCKIIGLRKGEKKDESLFYNKNYVKTLNNFIYNSNETLVVNSLEINKILNQIRNSKGNISSKLIDKMFGSVKKNNL